MPQMRLEKIVYEKAFNSGILNYRKRGIANPVRFYQNTRDEAKYFWFRRYNFSMVWPLFLKAYTPLIQFVYYNFPKDQCEQKGLHLQDLFVWDDKMLRRDHFTEHQFRSSFHPYQWVLSRHRRARYHKVADALHGAFAPDWLVNENRNVLYKEVAKLSDEYEDWQFINYYAELTDDIGVNEMGRLQPLSWLAPAGLFKQFHWNRIFYNEKQYPYQGHVTPKMMKDMYDHLESDYTKIQQRKNFENSINFLVKNFPGTWTRDQNTKFDFEEHYIRDAIRKNLNLESFQPEKVEEVRQKILLEKQEDQLFLEDSQQKGKSGKYIGQKTPEHMKQSKRTIFQQNGNRLRTA